MASSSADKEWTVVQFHNNGGNVEISVVPIKWLVQEDSVCYCFWPNVQRTKIRKYIKKIMLPKLEESDSDESWAKYEARILLKCPVSYETALQEEKRLEDESDKSGISSADPDKEGQGNKRKKRKSRMMGGFIETPSSSDDEVYLPNPPKIIKMACDNLDKAGSDDDTLSYTSSQLMPPPPVPMLENGEDVPRMSSNEMPSTSQKSLEGDNNDVFEEQNSNIENGENIGLNSKDKLDHILKQTIENRILLERVLNNLANLPKAHPNNSGSVDTYTLPKEPFRKYRDLLVYDKKIQESEECSSQLENLFNICGGSNEKDAITRGLKYIFSNKLARKCSWLGRKNNYPCCDLKALAVLKGATRRLYPTTDKAFEKIVGDWLRQGNLRYQREKDKKKNV